jgi:hypothetical protein
LGVAFGRSPTALIWRTIRDVVVPHTIGTAVAPELRIVTRIIAVTDIQRPRLRLEGNDQMSDRARVTAEFREMPGLCLTDAQAARLFSLDVARCRRLLSALVSEGVLWAERGVFHLTDAGRRHA